MPLLLLILQLLVRLPMLLGICSQQIRVLLLMMAMLFGQDERSYTHGSLWQAVPDA